MSIIYEALQKVEKKEVGIGFNITQKKEVSLPQPNSLRMPVVLVILVVLFSLSMAGSKLITQRKQVHARRTSLPKSTGAVTPPAISLGNSSPQEYASTVAPNSTTDIYMRYGLQGIVYDSQNPIAIINGKQLSIGQSIEEATVIDITQKGVELEVKGNKIYIPLEE